MTQQREAIALEQLFAGGGETGAMMRSLDWSRHPLGSVEQWPQSLKTTVRIMLTSRQPMFVWWGEQLINLYNDAYKSIVGGKHPKALGQPASEVWHEIWDQVRPRAESAMLKNEGTYDEALLLIMERNGYPEETYYTFSYSPVPNDQGGTGGIICANTDDTQRIIGERQLSLLRELAAKTADARTFDDACTRSAKCLETNPYDLPFAMIYLVDPGQECVVLAGTSGIDRKHTAVPETIALDSDSPWAFAEAIATHKPCLLNDLEALFGNLPMGAWQRPPHQAVIVPIAPSGETGQAGILIVGLNPFRLFDDNYRGFIDLTAAQIAASIANAQAYEEERKRAEALAELDRAKTIFFSNISHEFRTPLTLMLGPLEEMLANSGRLLPSERSHLETAHRNSRRLLKLVNTLLDFSRIEAGRVQAVYESTDLAMFTADLAGMFRCAIEQAGMRLCVDCPPLPEPVYVDREMWEKIVLNLLSNAFKFTWEGEITVALRWRDDHVELEVRDTGGGIPAEEMPHLFERFHRVEGARGRTYEGSGIGLSLVQELVKLHGGTIQVSSVVERGSCFTVLIPTGYAHIPQERIRTPRTLASTAMGAATYVEEALRWLPEGAGEPGSRGAGELGSRGAGELGSRGAGELGSRGAGELGRSSYEDRGAGELGRELYPVSLNSCVPSAHILLADDNADMRDYVKRLLLSQGYDVETVGDGIAALARIRERIPHLVLTDVMMPRLDGLGLLRSLRDDPRTREIPIILLSARAGEESRIQGLEAGADDYLIKPFSARELLARVEASLKLAQMRQESTDREEVLRAEIQSAKDTLENILSRIEDQFLALDQDWRYTYVNDRVVEVTGKSREELLGKSIWKLYPDTIGSQFEIEVQRAVAEQVPIQFEYFYPSLNRWFENRIYPSLNGLSMFVADISDRKQAEEALRQREAELQLITDTVPALIAYVDPDCRYRFANRAFTRWFGKPVEQMIGQRVEECVGETAYQYIRSDIEKALAGESVTSELWVPFREGGSRYVRRQYIPDIDAQGEVQGFFAMITDLTDLKRTQEAFRASEERFGVIVNQATVGIAQMDLTAQFVLVNQRYCDIVGYPMAELLHKRKQDITHPEDLPHNMELFHRLVTQGESYAIEKRYIRKDGSEVWVSNNVAAICDASGKPESVISVVLDISEQQAALRDRQQAEAAWREGKQILDALMEYIPEGITIADAPDVTIRQISKYGQHLLGRSREVLEGISAEQQVEKWGILRADGITQPAPEDLPLTRAVKHAQVVTNEEWVIQRPNGEKINILCNAGPIQTQDGKTTGGIIAWQDITERKQAEEALRQALLKLNFHVENTPMAVVEWDRDFRIIRWSAAAERILGWKAEEVIGKQLTELRFVYEEDAEPVAELCRRLIYSEESHIFGYNRNYTKNGDIVHCEWYNSSLRDEFGRMTSVLSLVLDVTERKQAEQEREQLLKREQAARADSEAARSAAETANRIKDEFLAVLSHELRSPLNPILGWSRLLQTRKFDAAKTAEALATIERNAKLQAELIEDLLDVSRILRGKLSLNITSVALTFTIQAAMETVRLAAEAKSIQIYTKLEPQVGKVSGDASRLQQVVWNLLSNAIKFTPPGGRVDIQLERIGSYAQITVSDTGKGIPVEFLPHVFDYFRQADATTTRKFGGLGLGLAIVHHLVELHGGTVQADSAGEGQGATFTVRIPLLLSPPQSEQDSEQPEPSLDLQGIEILVVDDDVDTREFVAFLLEQYGAQVRAVGSAGEALEALTQSVPDVLLSDIGMPEMDGYMLMQQVRTLPPEQGGQILAIALTAYAGEINYQQALSAGFHSHLSKPVEPAELVALVTQLTQRR